MTPGIVHPDKPGLEVAFKEGEMVPFKGFWFRIDKVEKAAMTLKPIGVTHKLAKKVKEANDARR